MGGLAQGEKMSFYAKGWTLGQLNALVKRLDEVGGEGAAKRSLSQNFELRFLESPLLGDPLHSITIPAAKHLLVDEVFKEDRLDDVSIGYVGSNFRRVFGGRKASTLSGSLNLRLRPLMRSSKDGPIVEELGGRKKAGVTLADLHAVMHHLGRPDKVVWVVGYVDDPNDPEDQWAVYAYWYPDCGDWVVEAYSAESPDLWRAGSLFLSRGS